MVEGAVRWDTAACLETMRHDRALGACLWSMLFTEIFYPGVPSFVFVWYRMLAFALGIIGHAREQW
jgi:hypothetical protein